MSDDFRDLFLKQVEHTDAVIRERDQLRAECERLRSIAAEATQLMDYLDLVEKQASAHGTGCVGADLAGEPLAYIQPSARQSLRRETRALRAALSSTLTPADGSGT